MPHAPSGFGQLALNAARQGSEVIRKSMKGEITVQTKTSHRDLVTQVDGAAESAIVNHLRTHRPNDAILGEEGGDQLGTTGVRWIVDPLDGTANIVRRRDENAVAVAVEVDGEFVAGAIVRPSSGHWLTADETGISASSGSLSVSGVQKLPNALISVRVSVSADRRLVTFTVLQGLLPSVQDFRRTGSTSCDLFDVATGVLDAYVGIGTKPWDIVAGWAVTNVARGKCLRFPAAGGMKHSF
jgi:myo-inositol-1(or 4)-monophosphatase